MTQANITKPCQGKKTKMLKPCQGQKDHDVKTLPRTKRPRCLDLAKNNKGLLMLGLLKSRPQHLLSLIELPVRGRV